MAFTRGLSDPFVDELKVGRLAPLLATCRKARLDVRIRGEYVDAYRWGGSLMNLSNVSGVPVFKCHRKYLEGTSLADALPRASGEYRFAPVCEDVTRAFDASVARMARNAEVIHGKDCEGELEDRVASHNVCGDPVQVIDRQVTGDAIPGEIDIVGVTAEATPRFVIVELKRYPNNDIQEAPVQLDGYRAAVSVDGRLRPEFSDSYQRVCRNLAALGFAAPSPEDVREGMPVVALLAVEGLPSNSELLPRARDLADERRLPGSFVLLRPGTLRLPPAEKWRSLRRDD